jgi:hypothetical protein
MTKTILDFNESTSSYTILDQNNYIYEKHLFRIFINNSGIEQYDNQELRQVALVYIDHSNDDEITEDDVVIMSYKEYDDFINEIEENNFEHDTYNKLLDAFKIFDK